jgi:hypothetical protein
MVEVIEKFSKTLFWGESWWSVAMSFSEIQALLGKLRQFRKKR